MMLDSSIGQLWHPVWKVWWTIFGVPMSAGLHWLVTGPSINPLVQASTPITLDWVIRGAPKSVGLHDPRSLALPNVAASPSPVFGHAALAAAIGMLILAVPAGLTTFVQTEMMTPAGRIAGEDPT